MSVFPIRIENNGFIDQIRSQVFAGGLEVLNSAEIGSVDVVVGRFFEDIPFQSSTREISISIQNQNGGIISTDLPEFFQGTLSFNNDLIPTSIFNVEDLIIDYDILNEAGAIIENLSGGAIRSINFVRGDIEVTQNFRISNFGVIEAGPTRAAIEIDMNPTGGARAIGAATITNFGLIVGDVLIGAENDNFVDVTTAIEGATVGNFGAIVGDVLFGMGDDIFATDLNAELDGLVDGGAGVDVLNFEIEDSVAESNLDLSEIGPAGPFQNFEVFQKSGVGTLALEGDGTIDRTEVLLGRLDVEGLLTTDLSVLAKGILGGNGAIIGDVVNFGAISPGASIGALTINGDLALNPASVLEIEFDETAVDALIVNGDFVIDDGVLLLTPLGAIPASSQSFEFLFANSVSGSFSEIAFSGFSGFGDIAFDASGAVSVAFTPQFEFAPGFSANALSAVNYLNELIITDAGTDISDGVISSLFGLSSDPAVLENALLSIGPEAFAATAAIGVEQTFLAKDLVRGRGADFARRGDGKYFWLTGAGGFARYEGGISGDGASSFEVDSRGIIGGAEIVRGDALIGAFGGALNSEQEFRNGLVDTNADGFIIGGYGGWSASAFNTIASFGYIIGDAETNRSVPFLGEQLRSGHDFDAFTAQSQSRYEIGLGELSVTPLVGLTYIRTDRDIVSEGGGAAALDIADQVESFLYLDIGGEAARPFKINDQVAINSALSIGWRYETLGYSIETDATLGETGFFGLSGSAADFERSRLIIGGELSANLSDRVEVFAKYRGEYGDDFTDNNVSGGIAIRF